MGKDNKKYLHLNSDQQKNRPDSQRMNNIGIPPVNPEIPTNVQIPDAFTIKEALEKFKLDPMNNFTLHNRFIIAPLETKPVNESPIIGIDNQPMKSGYYDEHPEQGLIILVGNRNYESNVIPENITEGDVVLLNLDWYERVSTIVINGYKFPLILLTDIVLFKKKKCVENYDDKKVIVLKAKI